MTDYTRIYLTSGDMPVVIGDVEGIADALVGDGESAGLVRLVSVSWQHPDGEDFDDDCPAYVDALILVSPAAVTAVEQVGSWLGGRIDDARRHELAGEFADVD